MPPKQVVGTRNVDMTITMTIRTVYITTHKATKELETTMHETKEGKYNQMLDH